MIGSNSFDPTAVATEMAKRGETWADADAAFKALEDTTKSVLSECMADYEGEAHNKAETMARRDPRYTNHLKALGEARRASNRAKVRYDTYRAWVDLLRTQEATKRAEMGMR